MGEEKQIDQLFRMMGKFGASDLHLKVYSPPILRINQVPQRVKSSALTPEQVEKLVDEILPSALRREFMQRGSVDFAYSLSGVGRFRVNVYQQRGMISLCARRVNFQIPTIKDLNLPPSLEKIARMESGLVLVAGITGSGKSTTLASLIDVVNRSRRCHIITIEDPIEYLYKDDKAFVNQREVGIDCETFAVGLRDSLRQDPDVVLIGELRDMESMETAIIAAETGHLVFGTIHAGSAAQSIGRILDYFPQERHDQIRQLLYFNLRGVLVQKLLPGKRKEIPLVPAVEIMYSNPSVRKMIHEGEDDKIPDIIRGANQEGMQDFNQSMVGLVKSGLVATEVALEHSPNPEGLKMNLQGIYLGSDKSSLVG
jgi:twitching motility protein PilT